ncbi:alkaline phosphatase family protein [Prauserella muralis]|uniref:Phosphodiesterase n=1 Tax=Prauserella muralis TaxID=588067 RepID=A0A2V4AL27_9PSEU|nr:alkaline phosphatase family protein [Prauserella muralis]PXY20942.1 phosphodiesterase [Prauserella muralis]TWE29998.1 type I phosphodiesterase/nucleotide pyrophosphatase [Prauserella muralis]
MDLPVIADDVPHLSRVVPSMLHALGAEGFAADLDLPRVSRACVLLVDGLGWELLGEYAADAPTLSALWRTPLRAGYPATTAAGLAALGTGLASGEHGMAGYTFEVPGTGVLNALRWCSHPDGADLSESLAAEDVQPLPTTFAGAAEAGLTTSVVSSAKFAGTSLTRAVLRGGTFVGVHALGDLVSATHTALEQPGSFCYAYHSELDLLGHLYGPGSAAWRMQLRQVDRLVESIVDGLPEDSLLAVVADHGMVAVDDTVADVDTTPALREGVRALGGEVRARHVYTEDGATADVLAAWHETLGPRAWVAERDHAIELGWFGERVSDRVRPRLGDVVVAARAHSGVVRSEAEPMESRLVGQHGSFTPAEQLVPLALAYG